MSEAIVLHACPRACSLVSHLALEHAGARFELRFVDLFKGEQHKSEYRALNRRGKVPFLSIGTEGIAENIAILSWIARRVPQAGLLPPLESNDAIHALSDLSWFSSSVHPVISRIVVPERFTSDKDGLEPIRKVACAALAAEFALIDSLLGERQWWWPGRPSAADFYLFWFWARVSDAPFDLGPYPNYRAHIVKLGQLPAVQ
ncbi:MAG: glutathione S-transferase family protein, partial [Gammaproteobacteria bacterium]|nr:glutathione S-transferase family protein [Gammaproteobacteria bacterium]